MITSAGCCEAGTGPRAVQRAGRQIDPAARLASAAAPAGEAGAVPAGVAVNAEGKVEEVKRDEAGLDRITGRSPETAPLIARYGRNVAEGLYLFVDSGQPEEVVCDAGRAGVCADTLVFDEFAGRVLEAKHATATHVQDLRGPQRSAVGQRTHRGKEHTGTHCGGAAPAAHPAGAGSRVGTRFPHKAWSRFCQGGKWDATVAHTGKGSLAVVGGTYTATMPQWKYFNRQGAAQFVSLSQTAPQPIVVRLEQSGGSRHFRGGRPRHPGRAGATSTPARATPTACTSTWTIRTASGPRCRHGALLARHPRLAREEHPRGAHPAR